MRKKIVAGNWKMNKNIEEGLTLASEINEIAKKEDIKGVNLIIGTPFIHLAEVNKLVDKNVISISAQNCATENSGAYTGEVSAEMVKSCGCKYVIIGHSERRSYYGETSEMLVKKIECALKNNLKVIFCVGENLEERESNKHFEIIKTQLEEAIFHIDKETIHNIVIAYEPVWAIGTGKTASSKQAQEMHAFIRNIIAEKYNTEIAEEISILYGGSCKPSNAKELFANKDVDGGLIGGASLNANDFIEIAKSF